MNQTSKKIIWWLILVSCSVLGSYFTRTVLLNQNWEISKDVLKNPYALLLIVVITLAVIFGPKQKKG